MTNYYVNNKINYKYLENILISFDPTWKYWSIENHILCFIFLNKKNY